MSRIIAVIRRDFQHVRHNVIALLVCVGLAIMPSLYAWFNIAGGWDPYANTSQIKVAVANSDEGIKGSVIPFRLNVGERVVTALTGSTKIGYVFTSEEEAIDGVASGDFYAAVVIPKDFSSKLLSVLTSDPTHPELEYYVNQKRNAIASIVTGKASGSVQTMIDEGFTTAVSEAATTLMEELSSLLDDDGVISMASNLDGELERSLAALHRTSEDIAAYRDVVVSIRSVTESAGTVLGSNSLSIDAANMLSEAAGGVRDFESAASTAEGATSAAISGGVSSVQDVENTIDNAFATADGSVDKLVAGLGKAREAAVTARDSLQGFYELLESLNGTVVDFSDEMENTIGETPINIQRTRTVTNDLSDALSRTENALSYLDDLIATIDKTVTDTQAAKGNAQESRAALADRAAKARESIESLQASYNNKLSGSLGEMACAIDEAASDAAGVSSSLREEVDNLSPMLSDASSGLKKLETTLDDAAAKVNEAAEKIDALRTKISDALSSGDMELIRTIFGADPTALVDFFAAPVTLDREAIYPVENNGSAMTPYYTTMALWVGGTLMGILFYVGLSATALKETRAKPRHAYFGRLFFFLVVGFCQSTILLLGDIFFLRVQCENPVLFMLTGWIASFVFINIIYSLSTSFGDVGKAIGVLFMVIQVAGSGGTFPVEMLPGVFQTLYRFLPFVYSENAFRASMFGVFGNEWLMDVGTLALYLIPALLLGLLLRKPLVPVNEWIEEKLEETKLM